MFLGVITLETKFREGELRTTRERRKMVPETGLKGRNYSSYRMSLRISLGSEGDLQIVNMWITAEV